MTMRDLCSRAVLAISLLHPASSIAQTSPHAGPALDGETTNQQQARDAAEAAIRSGQILLDRHLTAAQKAQPLDPELLDTILRAEGMYDPTRIGLFGQALRMQVRSGSAFATDLFDGKWARAARDPNVHRRIDYLAKAWFGPRPNNCRDFWIDRHDGGAVALDSLTADECGRIRVERGTEALTPVVAARLSLPVFTAPYPGNRLSAEQLAAYQRMRIKLVQHSRWFRGPFLAAPPIGTR